jgi:sulfite exporter TauE/SafE
MRLPGVEAVTANAVHGRAVITGRPAPHEVEAAIRDLGYAPGAPSWLSRDRQVWASALAGVLVVVVLLALTRRLGLTSYSPGTADGVLLGLLVGLVAGVSTCMALVGGLVLGLSASAAARSGAGPRARLRIQAVFTAGRILGFAAGGALLGAVGSAAWLPGSAIAAAALVAAVVMGLLGVRLSGVSPRVSGWTPTLPGGRSERLALGRGRGAAVAGAATFLLPCGFTQAVQVYAISLGSPVRSGATMAAFAVGTAPGLLGLGLLGGLATRRQPEITGSEAPVGGRGGLRAVGWRLRAAGGALPGVVGVLLIAFAAVNGAGGLRALGVDLTGLPGLSGLPGAASPPAVGSVTSNVTLTGDRQVVTMRQSASGYSPEETTVWAGIPIDWDVEITDGYTCSSFLRIPSVGVSADLPRTGRHVVKVPALPVGSTPFTCTMGMFGGHFHAIPRPPTG